MWEILYDMISKVLIYGTLALGTIERILDGNSKKADETTVFEAITKMARSTTSIYMVLKIYLRKTREPYRCYYKNSVDRYKVGGKGLITDHAVVSNPFIPIMESLAITAEALFRNSIVDQFYRKQRTFGMYHIGHKMYAGRVLSMRLMVSPYEAYMFLIKNPDVIKEQTHVIIHDTYVEVYFKKSIKKGESVITTNPPFGVMPANHDTVLISSPVSQNPVNVLS